MVFVNGFGTSVSWVHTPAVWVEECPLNTVSDFCLAADFGVSAKNLKTLQKRDSFIGTPYWWVVQFLEREWQTEGSTSDSPRWPLAAIEEREQCQGLLSQPAGSEPGHHQQALWPWPSCLASLYLSFLLHEIRDRTAPVSQVVETMKWDNAIENTSLGMPQREPLENSSILFF